MKKLITTLALLLMFAVGCTDQTKITSPEDNTSSSTVNWGQITQYTKADFIKLPKAETLSLQKTVSISKWIYGNNESLLDLNAGYPGGPFGWVSITANARFQRNSFIGQKYVTLSVDDQNAGCTFLPSSTFTRPVLFNMTIMGVDLSGINPSQVRFVYMAPDGNYYLANYQSIYVEPQSGKIQIINAELPHFSRYGFVN